MAAHTQKIIWQYWETRDFKPRYIDGLLEIARRVGGVEIVLVTPENLGAYLPNLEDAIHGIANLAHKADMIRTRLVKRHGGMWLDSDAIVLRDLNGFFDLLEEHEFVGFNNGCRLASERPWVRVCCFLSRPEGTIISEWVRRQHAKLEQTKFRWSEIGAEMLNAVCLEHRGRAKILPFERISPFAAKAVDAFMLKDDKRAQQIVEECTMVMLSNASLQKKNIPLHEQTVDEISAGDTLIARIMREALAR